MLDYVIIIALVLAISSTPRQEYWIALFRIANHKRKLLIIVSVFIIINGCFTFPFELHDIYSSGTIYSLTVTTFILYGCFRDKYLKSFTISFFLQTIGLVCRILLEWGEYTLTRDLTIVNAVFHIIWFPFFVLIMNIILNYVMTKENNQKYI